MQEVPGSIPGLDLFISCLQYEYTVDSQIKFHSHVQGSTMHAAPLQLISFSFGSVLSGKSPKVTTENTLVNLFSATCTIELLRYLPCVTMIVRP